jgi:signal transduction histidine kinase
MGTNDRLNILLVDDQPAKLLTYSAILSELGENLIEATSAGQALECLLKTEVAVVLIDVCMPDLDGYELAAMIREHPRHQRTSIIFVSAILMTDLDRLRGYECGAVDYVPVPVVPEILRAKVSVFSELYRKTRELERLNDELERRVALRTAELEASSMRLRENEARLQEANRLKDEFLATLAHELRNPLAPIRTAVQLLGRHDLPEGQRQRAREIIERQVGQMVRLVDDLIDVSRISRGVIALKVQPLELGHVVARAVEMSRPAVDQGRHVLTVRQPEEPVRLEGDETRLAQVLANLLNNAAKYTAEGGQIGLAATVDGSHVEIRVTDNGIGIAGADLPRVFDMFVQVHHEYQRPLSGLGIGLALVERLVRMHGGDVTARSDGPGSGSEFVVRLPLAQAATAAAAARPAVEQTSSMPIAGAGAGLRPGQGRAARRILVADDNADAAETLGILLRAAGHDVWIARDGLEALELAEQFCPEAIFLDLGMPRLDGCETAVRIRQLPWGRAVLLVAVTGWGQEQDRSRTAAAGFDAHIVKPVAAADILSLVGRLGRD